MYVHAYQSRVWNEMASERISKYGTKPIIGDLVLVEVQETETAVSEAAPTEEEIVEDAETVVEDETQPIEQQPSEQQRDTDPSKKTNRRPERIKTKAIYIETEDDLKKYTIEDIVLPLPGHSVVYPKNAIGDFYKEYMAKDGFDPQEMLRKQKYV
jgi:tRNA pseudouridine13 synthase